MSSLFDMMLRHQIYLEGVKVALVADINNTYTRKLDAHIKRRLDRLPFDKLDALSKTGVTNFAKDIEREQKKLLKEWRSELKSRLRDYAKIESSVTGAVYKKAGKVPKRPGIRDLWADVVDEKVSGVDSKLDKMMSDFISSQTKALRTVVRSNALAGVTKEELYDKIKGTKEQGYKNGLFRKFNNHANTISSTSLQHVKGRVQNAIGEETFDRYRWVSVIDSGTTHICRERAGQIFRYGSGPVPPAHFRCRSSIVPIAEEIEEPSDVDPPFFDWIQAQPEEFIRDIYNKRDAAALISGRAKRADYEHFQGIGRLTLEGFKNKLPIITA